AHLPFQPSWHYPSTLERATYKLLVGAFLIGVGNRLWPVPPLYFGVSVVAATAYHMRLQTNASFVTAYIPIFAIRWALKHFFFSYHGYLFESPVQPSLKTKIWRRNRRFQIVHKILAYAPRRLQSCDALLPSLPLPKLSDTIEPYEFAKRDGKLLQIVTWIYWCFVDNYVTPFWEKCAYLSSRNGLLINTSFGHCDIFQQRPSISQAERTARLMFLECLSMMAVDRQEIVPVGVRTLSAFPVYVWPFSVSSFVHPSSLAYLCLAILRPIENGATIMHCPSHVRRMLVKKIPIPGKTDLFCSAAENAVIKIAKQKPIFCFGILRNTQCSRHLSKHFVLIHKGRYYKVKAYDENNRLHSIEYLTEFFINNAINRRALETIESAISFGSIEDNDLFSLGNTEFLEQFDKFMLVGDGKNIWADKSVCFSVSRNARWGGTNEHSIGDAIDHDLFLENFVTMDYCPTSACARYNCHSNKKIERINFDISEEMKREIMRCYREYKPQADDVDLSMMSSVRLFANSRTETLRSVTKESCAFVLAMLDQQCTAPKVASLPNEDKQPELSWFGGSFAAVTNDGYGICYRFAGNHSICIHITSYHSASNTVQNDSHRFQKHLSDSLREMAALLSNHRVCTASKCKTHNM
uniref:Choline/carnitine acyltransferase domain-containing protein n=1 Tax=Parascaris equorum TaxID=6256 RepID=A0A914RXA2_PAREQ